jgi:threonine synthase
VLYLLQETTDIIGDGTKIQIIHIIPIAQTRENLREATKIKITHIIPIAQTPVNLREATKNKYQLRTDSLSFLTTKKVAQIAWASMRHQNYTFTIMPGLLYYSTNRQSPSISFREALLQGQAPDKGLYMPETIPQLNADEIKSFINKPYHEIAFDVTGKYLAGEIPADELRRIVKEAYNYPVPLEPVYQRKYIMRLDQGPTASFKDFAARMMGRLMHYYLTLENRNLLILTATSGDTGSAIANAFYGFDNIKVVVLFPEKEVTNRQRKQMTTLGKNVEVISIDGKFDDCQALVKEAFADPDLLHLNLSSANSINIGRLVPQIVYYFYAFARLRVGNRDDNVIFSVPSGNFGDMMGGVLAMKMGLPVKRFIIGVNKNDEFPKYLETGEYRKVEPSRNCISSAMNVGHPGNLARLVSLYGGMMDEKGVISRQADMDLMRKELFSVSITDETTRQTIKDTWEDHNVLFEPHGAVGWAGLQAFVKDEGKDLDRDQLFVSLETAHPAKFPEEINLLLGFDPELPPSLQGIEDKEESYGCMQNEYTTFKEYLRSRY